MAIYKHKESGIIIVTDSELRGDWIIVDESKKTAKKKTSAASE
ncbi:hypothetical protein [Streptococcus suis]|uniref:Uncharacterized protein n=1 Tax=Streptococcus suis TaxID=1307 RepID=A0AAW5LTQ1_STRSU|nr:hypothetical protein [Streptococcus suis]MCR1233231.1 hypothetical protein [Streptococcus suis]